MTRDFRTTAIKQIAKRAPYRVASSFGMRWKAQRARIGLIPHTIYEIEIYKGYGFHLMGIGMLKQQQATKTFEVRSGSLNTTLHSIWTDNRKVGEGVP